MNEKYKAIREGIHVECCRECGREKRKFKNCTVCGLPMCLDCYNISHECMDCIKIEAIENRLYKRNKL